MARPTVAAGVGPVNLVRAEAAPRRFVARCLLVVLLVLAVLPGALALAGHGTARNVIDRLRSQSVATTHFEFEPAALTMSAGRTGRFLVRNDDLALHTFTIDELGVDAIVKPGEEVLVVVPAAPAGDYTLYCRPHTQDGEGMVGTLTVD